VKKNRPVNLNLAAMSWPVTAISSGLHRITGILLFISVPFVLWALEMSLTESGFHELKVILTGFVAKFVIWAILAMLAYHIVAGVRHLLMDSGIGESLEGARLGSYTVIALGVVMAALLGVWIW